jgi:hypothetical protein
MESTNITRQFADMISSDERMERDTQNAKSEALVDA